MNVLQARNVHRALPMAVVLLNNYGVERPSRNGLVLQSGLPVTTVYERPLERVMFWPQRDANPFFHFAESLWMLAGRDDVAFVNRFSKQIAAYSDDSVHFHAAYGARWRRGMPADNSPRESTWTALDQLPRIAAALKSNKDDRRQVLQIWDSRSDLGTDSKDLPCNLTATFQVTPTPTHPEGELNMVVFCRSNDIVWGCYGANAVHFSYLLEYVAALAGYPVGYYEQISVNWHGYRATFDPICDAFDLEDDQDSDVVTQPCPYEEGIVTPYPLMHPEEDPAQWDKDLLRLMRSGGRAPSDAVFHCAFFKDVALPMLRAHDAYKDGEGQVRYERAISELTVCRASDWKMAATEWLSRRYHKWQLENKS